MQWLKVEIYRLVCRFPNLHLYFFVLRTRTIFCHKIDVFLLPTNFLCDAMRIGIFRSIRAKAVPLVLDSRERQWAYRPRGTEQSRSDPPVEGARLSANRHIAQERHQARGDLQGVPRRSSASDYKCERRRRYAADDGGGLGQFHTFFSYLYCWLESLTLGPSLPPPVHFFLVHLLRRCWIWVAVVKK